MGWARKNLAKEERYLKSAFYYFVLYFSLPNTTILNWAVEVYFVWTSTGFHVLTTGSDLGSNFELVCTIFQVILNYKRGY